MNEKDIRASLTDEERLRLEKIDKLDSNQNRKKVILACVTVALIAIFALGTVFGARYILSYEGTAPMPDDNKSEIILPTDKAEILSLVSGMEATVKNETGIKLNRNSDVSLDSDSVTVEGGSKDLPGYFDFIKSSLTDIIRDRKNEKAFSGSFGEDISSHVPSVSFEQTDVSKAECRINEENESETEYEIVFNDFSSDEIPSLSFTGSFGLDDSSAVLDYLKEKFAPAADITEVTLDYTEPVFTAKAKSENAAPVSFTAECKCKVSALLTFKGIYEKLGSARIGFILNQKESYDFTYAGLSFNSDVFYISKGDSDELKYSVTSDLSPAEIQIKWLSSDPSVLSIDGNFYKAHKVSNEPVTVTGEFSYCGETYKAECLYWVRKELEDIKLSSKEITVSVGSCETITPEFKPADATVKNVRWFTENEKTASVDENGRVTGIAPGKTVVYLISEDGNFKRACTVTVKEG